MTPEVPGPHADPPADLTRLVRDAAGDQQAAADLLPLVYDQLRAIARQRMAAERADHTFQPTALVHEAYLRLSGERKLPWQNRAHYFAAAAEAMRRILLDHAKARVRVKRGGHTRKAPSSLIDLASFENPEEILALDDAICRLERESPEAAAVVRFRFFAGLNGDETAEALGISPRQVDRLWSFARAWLFRAMRSDMI